MKYCNQALGLLLLCLFIIFSSATSVQARFITPDTWDPMLAGVDINRYAYSGNDPVNQSDPNGHDMWDHIFNYNQADRDLSLSSIALEQEEQAYERFNAGDDYSANEIGKAAKENEDEVGVSNKDALVNGGIKAMAGYGLGKLAGAAIGPIAKKLFGPEKEIAIGPHNQIGGHHPHSARSFDGIADYRPGKGLSVSQKFMKEMDWSHDLMTAFQRKEYAKIRAAGKSPTITDENRISVGALEAGGASPSMARLITARSLRNLREQGVKWNSKANGWKK